MTKKYVMLIKNDAVNNNNKFYEIKLEDDDSVVARYGRVGATGATEHKGYGEATFERVKKSKIDTRKGYREVDIVVSESGSGAVSSKGGKLADIAKRDIAKGNTELHDLLERLAEVNRFQLLAASGGQIDIVDGEVKTALGVLIPLSSIDSAKNKLNELSKLVESGDTGTEYVHTLQDYLSLVPQKIPSRRGWDKTFFTDFTNFQDQYNFLDQLESSVKNSKPVEQIKEDVEIEKVFGYSLETVEDGKVFDKINKFYKKGLNSRHASANRKLFKIYKMINAEKESLYEEIAKKLGNVRELWHGSQPTNVLSILKSGLIIPPTTGGNYTIAGRLFGPGVYMSDQSTKSLNYSIGYWGNSRVQGNVFMFHCEAAMGKEYIPTYGMQKIPQGYDSFFAKPGQSGIMNNEMIVPSLNQFALRYLCEFE